MEQDDSATTPHERIQPQDPPLGPVPVAFGHSVQRTADAVHARLKGESRLVADTFRKCFLTSLATATKILPDGSTFVTTGDIPNMWPRDAAGSFEPYLHLCRKDDALHGVVVGLIRRLAECLTLEPYANSFNPEANHRHYWPGDRPPPGPWIRERKWSVDTPVSFLKLAADLQAATGSVAFLDEAFYLAAKTIVETFRVEQDHAASSDYLFQRDDPDHPGDTLSHDGRGAPVQPTGMIWSGFRPSDDPCRYGYSIPQNMAAVSVLIWLADVFRDRYGDAAHANRASIMANQIRTGIESFGVVDHPEFGRIYGFEVDGFGNAEIMDDATPPNLTGAPLTGYLAAADVTYQRTRRFALSTDNPYFIVGKHARGLGSAHPYNASPENYVWHIGLIVEGLTAPTKQDQWRIIETCAATTGGTGFMHEAFDARDPTQYIRGWCPWNTSQFAALVLSWLDR
jgi:meiotically up-regulated gene 157 (Mug157) protein